MLEHIGQFARDRVLINRDRDASKRMSRELCRVEAWAVVADHGQPVASRETFRGKSGGEVTYVSEIVAPAPGLPYAQVFLADRRAIAEVTGVPSEQAR